MLSALGWVFKFVFFPEAYDWPHLVAGIDLKPRAGAETGVRREQVSKITATRLPTKRDFCFISANGSGLGGLKALIQ
jgi:hypothetical protein